MLLVQIKSRQLVMDDSSSMHVNSKGSTSYQEGRIAASTVLTLIMAFIEWPVSMDLESAVIAVFWTNPDWCHKYR